MYFQKNFMVNSSLHAKIHVSIYIRANINTCFIDQFIGLINKKILNLANSLIIPNVTKHPNVNSYLHANTKEPKLLKLG